MEIFVLYGKINKKLILELILLCLSREILEFANYTISWYIRKFNLKKRTNFIPFLFLSFHNHLYTLYIKIVQVLSTSIIWKSWRYSRTIFANVSPFEKETKSEKRKEERSNHKVLGKNGQRFWRKNDHEFSSNGYRARPLPFSFRPSSVWFAHAISTSGLSQFLRGSRYLQWRAFRAGPECNENIRVSVYVIRVTRK